MLFFLIVSNVFQFFVHTDDQFVHIQSGLVLHFVLHFGKVSVQNLC